MMCQCTFINCNKYTTLVQDIDSGGGCVWGQGVYGNSMYLLLNFAVNLKLPPKLKY